MFSCNRLHRNENKTLGLWPERLVFDSLDTAKNEAMKAPSEEQSVKELETRTAREKALEAKLTKEKEPLAAKLAAYNERFEEKVPVGDLLSSEAIKQALERIKAIEKGLMRAPTTAEKINAIAKKTPIISPLAKETRQGQYRALSEIKTGLNQFLKKALEFEAARTENVSARGAHLNQLSERAQTMQESLAAFEKKGGYQHIKGAYERVIGEKDPAFSALFEKEGNFSDQKAREYRQLFFAILARETNNFEDGFALGRDFRNNAEENRVKYPFLYNEWIRLKGDLNEKTTAKKIKLDQKKAEAEQGRSALENLTSGGLLNKYKVENLAEKVKITPDQIEYHRARAKAYGEMTYLLRNEVANQSDLHKELKEEYQQDLKKFIPVLEVFKQYEEAEADYAQSIDRSGDADKSFTRTNLMKHGNYQVMVELAMRQFVKAVETVERPADKSANGESLYSPSVKRMMIGLVYKKGVGDTRYNSKGEPEYVDSVKPDYQWALTELVQSTEFNRLMRGKFLNDDKRAALLVARMASEAKVDIKYLDYHINGFKEMIALKKANDPWPAKDSPEWKIIERKVRPGNAFLMERDLASIEAELAKFEERKKTFPQFIEKAARLIRNPQSGDSKKFLEEIRRGDTVKLTGWTAEEISAMEEEMKNLDFTYQTLDLQERTRQDYFERMGINVQGAYLNYVEFLRKNPDKPELRAENWDNVFLKDKAGSAKLTAMFREILPDTNLGGKADFLALMESMHGENALEPDRKMAVSIYNMLQQEILMRERAGAESDQKQIAVQEKLDGMTIGDKITEYGKGVLNMLIGPNQSISNRAAGAAIVWTIWKGIGAARKGEGGWGKTLRLLFGATAAELAVKHITGRGLLDRMSMDSLAQAMEGSYEGVHIAQQKKNMEAMGINSDQHGAALMELNKVPFAQVMAWYESTKPNGMPKVDGAEDLFPSQIDVERVLQRGYVRKSENEVMEARRIVKATVKQFFAYVGRGHDEKYGQDALKERWIKAIQDKNYDLSKSEFTAFMPTDIVGRFRENPAGMSWLEVMRMETDVEHLEMTKGKHGAQALANGLKEVKDWVMPWARQTLLGPGSEHYKNLAEYVGDDLAPATAEFISEMLQHGANGAHFVGNKIEMGWERHKVELKSLGKDIVGIVVDGVTLPFKITYIAGKVVLPFTATKMRQIMALISQEDLDHFTKQYSNAEMAHIIEVGNDSLADMEESKKLGEASREGYLGWYRHGFAQALRAVNRDNYFETVDFNDPATARDPLKRNYIAGSREIEKKMPSEKGIGFYVSIVDKKEAGVLESDTQEQRTTKMRSFAIEKARQEFLKHNNSLNAEHFDMMNMIHMISETGNVNPPERVIAFFRMPLPSSVEFNLKVNGNWTDYDNAKKYMDRIPATFDPNLGIIENVERMIGTTGPLARRVMSYPFKFLGFQLKWMRGIPEGLSNFAKKRKWVWVEQLAKMDPKTDEWLDEVTTLPESGLAMSAFWKKHEQEYIDAIQFARAKGLPLYLGHIGKGGKDKRLNPTTFNDLPKIGDTQLTRPEEYAQKIKEWKQEKADKAAGVKTKPKPENKPARNGGKKRGRRRTP